ncbi:capsular polysaccharide biosynthesis protein [Pseudoalteromonas sp. A25]|uniref:hypothetical protein n=1 Tax=Pseudoalteromonas sp. A25 TaxID=116092 RepID=UPI001260BDC3|nr:hypothetical protein [Pseudoalteromonas sp. A25]BBN82625.1 capsular polysaccharide biosynthesis protein [Pseudoalteromonas sp. A25]
MSIKSFLKSLAGKLPAYLGIRASFISFKYRLGKSYIAYREAASGIDNRDEIFIQVKSLVEYCQKNIPFYRKFYQEKGFDFEQLSCFEDLQNIPVVTKADLQNIDFNDRNSGNGIVTNTGGTSGQPLKLMLDHKAYAREWAHMHSIWERIGYQTNSIKLTIRGMNLGSKPLNYNFIHNEFQVNAYCDFSLIVKELPKVIKKYRIEYLHGYPSGIYEFIKQMKKESPELLKLIKQNLKGVFFGSEYPAPIYRNFVEAELCVPTISWYGHTEMAVLAPEREEPFVYFPFQSYGYTEAVEVNGKHHLVGTTIHNRIGPLIRYDTGDLIEPVSYKDGLLESFRIAEGRTGEFVTDLNGRNISLTALIFGRHHPLFEHADFVQVKQKAEGYLTVYVTTQNENLDFETLFDSSGINMRIDFELLRKPFKTKSGKVPLLVKG